VWFEVEDREVGEGPSGVHGFRGGGYVCTHIGYRCGRAQGECWIGFGQQPGSRERGLVPAVSSSFFRENPSSSMVVELFLSSTTPPCLPCFSTAIDSAGSSSINAPAGSRHGDFPRTASWLIKEA
jgi:hypothetical protein